MVRREVAVGVGLVTDLLQGGLLFGWAALSAALRDMGQFSEHCSTSENGVCAWQEEWLELIWTLGAMSVNFGPVLIGPVLDAYGPKVTSITGVFCVFPRTLLRAFNGGNVVFARLSTPWSAMLPPPPGTIINVLSMLLLAVADSSTFNTYPYAITGLGLGGIAYHLAQFHKGDLFPSTKGVVSSMFNAGFSMSSLVLPGLLVAARAIQGGTLTMDGFRIAALLYAVLLASFIPLLAWLEPWRPQQYVADASDAGLPDSEHEFAGSSDAHATSPLLRGRTSSHLSSSQAPASDHIIDVPFRHHSALADAVYDMRAGTLTSMPIPASLGADEVLQSLRGPTDSASATRRRSTASRRSNASGPSQGSRPSHDVTATEPSQAPSVGLTPRPHSPALTTPRPSGAGPSEKSGSRQFSEEVPAVRSYTGEPDQTLSELSRLTRAVSQAQILDRNASLVESLRDHLPISDDGAPLSHEGMTFYQRLPPRWMRLRERSLWQQMHSPECIGMCIWYSLSVVMLQFYMGTSAEQLLLKGDRDGIVTQLVAPILALGFVAVPFVGWLLDRKGYGLTILVISVGGIACSICQAVPSLWFQIVTLFLWSLDRFCLYAAFYTIVGSIFGFGNFGRIIALKSGINGVVSLLQWPLHALVLHVLGSRFWIVSIAQALIGIAILPFSFKMIAWERQS